MYFCAINDPVVIPPFLSRSVSGSTSSLREKVCSVLLLAISTVRMFPMPPLSTFPKPTSSRIHSLEVVLKNQIKCNPEPENQLKISSRSL